MGKIKAFSSNTGIDGAAIVVERTDDFYHSAKQLGDFIKGLSLSNVDNDRLIALTMQQIRDAEQGGFNTGFRMGVQFAESR